MTDAPGTLDELRKIRDVEQRAVAASAYIERGQQKIREARRQRDQDVRALVKEHGLAETARRVGLSRSTVKVINRA